MSKNFTGEGRSAFFDDCYKRAGVACLVLWESGIKAHPARVAERLLRYTGLVAPHVQGTIVCPAPHPRLLENPVLPPADNLVSMVPD